MTYRVQKGVVYLVGAGPGDPGLLSIKAKLILEQADVVIYDNLVNQKVLDWLKPEARSIFVGKSSGQHSIPQDEINALLVKEAQNDVSIVRLKGGDPLVFGRAAAPTSRARRLSPRPLLPGNSLPVEEEYTPYELPDCGGRRPAAAAREHGRAPGALRARGAGHGERSRLQLLFK